MIYSIATIKQWNIKNAWQLKQSRPQDDIRIITDKAELTTKNLAGAEYVFFPHWSHIIPAEIYENFTCIVFHMTDLPFGRGGSPLQNLIVRGFEETKISALRVEKELDGGPVYMKSRLYLHGTAEEIYIRASEIIFKDMIPYILDNNPQPLPQSGEVTAFKRRKPADSELNEKMTLKQIYDHIRMLDAESYPPAFVTFGDYVMEFTHPKLTARGIVADVTIRRRDENV